VEDAKAPEKNPRTVVSTGIQVSPQIIVENGQIYTKPGPENAWTVWLQGNELGTFINVPKAP
jgi:hypothetical protein